MRPNNSNPRTDNDSMAQRFEVLSAAPGGWGRCLNYLQQLEKDLSNGKQPDLEQLSQIARLYSAHQNNLKIEFPTLTTRILTAYSMVAAPTEAPENAHLRADLWYLSKESEIQFCESEFGAYNVHGKRGYFSGGAGASALSIYAAFSGLLGSSQNFSGTAVPHDDGDFSRCIELFDKVPEARSALNTLAKISDNWGTWVNHWDAIEADYRRFGKIGAVIGSANEKNFYLAIDPDKLNAIEEFNRNNPFRTLPDQAAAKLKWDKGTSECKQVCAGPDSGLKITLRQGSIIYRGDLFQEVIHPYDIILNGRSYPVFARLPDMSLAHIHSVQTDLSVDL